MKNARPIEMETSVLEQCANSNRKPVTKQHPVRVELAGTTIGGGSRTIAHMSPFAPVAEGTRNCGGAPMFTSAQHKRCAHRQAKRSYTWADYSTEVAQWEREHPGFTYQQRDVYSRELARGMRL